MEPIVLNKENFEQEVLKSDKPVLVDFCAAWCGPCQMLSPVVDEIAKETTEFKVGKINVDEQMDLAQKYGIVSIPCLIVFKDGKEAKRHTGVIPKNQVLELVQNA